MNSINICPNNKINSIERNFDIIRIPEFINIVLDIERDTYNIHIN